MSALRRIFLFIISCLLFSFSATPTLAEDSTPSAKVVNPYIYTNPLSPQYTNIMAINLIHTLSCLAEGRSVIGQPCLEYTQLISEGGVVSSVLAESQNSGGALGSVSGFLATMYSTPPLSTTDYLADVGQNLHIIPEANAQVTGSGNNVLSPILQIWKVTRNIAYLGMIIIFIVIGFMIMFRQKINPQTVISAQAALPGLVVGLLLITFSYFFAALCVDASFVATRVAGKILESQNILVTGSTDRTLEDGNILTLYSSFLTSKNPIEVAGVTAETLGFLKQGIVGGIINMGSVIVGCNIGQNLAQIANPIVEDWTIPIIGVKVNPNKALGCPAGAAALLAFNNIPTPNGGTLAGGLAGLVLYVVLIIALIIAIFRTLFTLVISYITIMITTIAAPFYFLYSSIPGKEGAASAWFKTMFANILVFPAVYAALLFAAYLFGGTSFLFGSGSVAVTTNKVIDFSDGTLPLLGGLSSSFLQLVLSYGVLLVTPAIPGAVKAAFGVKDSPLGGAAIGTATQGFGAAKGFGERLASPWLKQREANEKIRLEKEAIRQTKVSTQEPNIVDRAGGN
ncbi:MAG: hypothetical protein Q7R49_06415 [Candidatus Daviesbacteria bacterium]|nr:hypothetical protein [Candidatus Daviesbacteria bacterium]